jgi:hypothetical protein
VSPSLPVWITFGEAERVGFQMRPTPVADLWQSEGRHSSDGRSSQLAIDLPLKALAWEDERGRVWLSYNAPEYLQQRHGFPLHFLQNIAGASVLIQKAVE